jgi:hypothetical protein
MDHGSMAFVIMFSWIVVLIELRIYYMTRAFSQVSIWTFHMSAILVKPLSAQSPNFMDLYVPKILPTGFLR